MARAIVLAEGALGKDDGKTAHGLILHALRDQILAVIDSTHAGSDAGEPVIGRPVGIPVVADYASAKRVADPEVLFLGSAPVGGRLPTSFRTTLLAALRDGLTVYSGLHQFLGDDPELAAAAEAGGGRLIDVRRPPADLRVADGRIFDCPVPRILVMGTDCAIGKRVTAMELVQAARARGLDTGFVATGQTGCMLGPDAGAVIDRIPGDFAAGEVERMVTEVAKHRRDAVIVYGQSSIRHPAFSGVALAILHGTRPAAVILQHDPVRSQRALFDHPAYRLGDLAEEIRLIEALGETRVVGVAVNGRDLADPAAACDAIQKETGLPAVDPLRMDITPLLDGAMAAARRWQEAPLATPLAERSNDRRPGR